jgi:hypothetical protein
MIRLWLAISVAVIVAYSAYLALFLGLVIR